MRLHAKASSAGTTQRRGAGWPIGALTALALLLIALTPGIASAGKVFVPTPFSPIDGSGTGVTIHFPSGIAVDEESGNVFLNVGADGAVEEVTDIFGAEGGHPTGVAPPGPYWIEDGFLFFAEFVPNGVAVDNSATSSSKGTVYVVDVGNGMVKKFARNAGAELYEAAGELTPTSGPAFSFPLGAAVDSHGNVFVADLESQSVIEFSPTGTQLARIDTSASVGTPSSVALDNAGDLFVQGLEEKVYKYPANGSGEIEATKFTQVLSTATTGVAVDPATNTLYVALGDHVNRYDATTLVPQGEFGAGVLSATNRIAVNSKTGRVYVSDAGAGNVAVFAQVILPDVVTGEPTPVGTQAATLNGTVNPSGAPLTECLFEYGTSTSYDHTAPCAESPASIGEGESPVAVHANLTGLAIGATYHFRLLAKNANGTVKGFDQSFRTAGPPEIKGETVHPHDTTARLAASIYPGRQETTYHFEYVTGAKFAQSGYAEATSVPLGGEAIGSGTKDVEVVQSIAGLTPASTYHFHAVATNASATVQGPDRTFTTYASPQVFEPCPANEAFRQGPGASLPDCRAYEQATPVDKNGGNPQGFLTTAKASINGDAVSFESNAGIPGGEGAQDFPTYLARRGADDWSTQGLLPPPSTGKTAGVLGWTADFSQVFDFAQRFGIGSALLSRSSANGSLTTVVPYTEPESNYLFSGASADGSKVFFEASVGGGGLTPEAAKDKLNLYAWDRDSEAIRLVGVLPDGTTPPGGSAPGLGGADVATYTQDMHAFSSDGSSAYFNAGEPEQLYLRLNPTAPETTQKDGKGNCIPDPVLACTVHVSASHKTGGDPGGPLPASFRGASTDGSVALFTSTEELTDDAHTTSAAPAVARADLSGGEIKNSFLPADATAVAVDGSHIYWANPSADAIGRAELNGEEPKPEFITGADNPQGVAVDGTHVYWTNAGSGAIGVGSIGRADLNGDNVNQSCVTGATNPRGIDLDANHIYWANSGVGLGHSNSSVGRADLECTPASVEQNFIAEGSGCREGARDVAVDAAHNHIYIARGNGGSICSADLDGTSPHGLPVSGAQQIAVDASHIYWTQATDLTPTGHPVRIDRSDLEGKNVESNFIDAQNPQGIAVDASHIYWGNHPSDTVRGADLYRYEAGSGELTDLMPDHTSSFGAEVQGVLGTSSDGSYVYFAANGVPSTVANSPNARGESASPGSCQSVKSPFSGTCNLYLAHAGTVSFIARLDAGGGSDGDIANWVSTSAVFPSTDFQKTARVSADGHTLLFRSRRQLTAYDNEGLPELYLYRAGEAGPTCVSCNPTGAPPAGRAELGSLKPPTLGAALPASILSRNLSADGSRVFFETRDSLLAADTNGDEGCPPWGSGQQQIKIVACQDVYEWEASGTGSCHSSATNGGCLYLISSGKSPDASFFIDASSSGDDAFIMTGSQLVRQDGDGLLDVYDVRVGGGFASQNEVPPVPCEGEGCKKGAEEPPAFQSPNTPRFSGPGNPAPKRSGCAKGSARKHGRCVKKRHHHKRKRQHRDAKTTRRASR